MTLVCGAGDCQSPWGYGGRHQSPRGRDDLHHPAATAGGV